MPWVESTSVTSQQLSDLPTMDLLRQLAEKPDDGQARSSVRTRLREEDLPERLAAAALRIVPWPTPAEVADHLRDPLTTGSALTSLTDDLLPRIAQAALAERRRDLLWLLATVTRPAGPLARLGDVLRTDPDADAILTRTLGLLEDDLLGSDATTEVALAERISTVVARIGPVAARPEPVAALLALLQLAPDSSPTLTETVLRLLPRLEPRVIGAAAERDDPAEILAAAAAVPLIPGSGRSTLLTVAAQSGLDGLTAPKTWAGVEIAHLARMLEAGELADVLARPDVGAAVVAPLAEASVAAATDRRQLAAVLTWPPELLDHVDTRVLARALTTIAASDRTVRRLLDDLRDLGTA